MTLDAERIIDNKYVIPQFHQCQGLSLVLLRWQAVRLSRNYAGPAESPASLYYILVACINPAETFHKQHSIPRLNE